MNIVILGPHGQVGGMLVNELAMAEFDSLRVTTIGRTAADIEWCDTNLVTLTNQLDQIKPDVIINAIAYTAVDKAESEPKLAYVLNADLPSALADWCARTNALLVHYSTDFVFDGMQPGAWKEWQETAPISVYGKTKLAGEKALQLSTAMSITLRTSWVYGETGNNFMKTMLRLGEQREELSVVDDQHGCPTYSRDLAKATISLIMQYQENNAKFVEKQQLYHLSGKGKTTWYGFAKEIFAMAADYQTLALKKLNAIPSSDYPTPAVRPCNSELDCTEILTDYQIAAVDWRVSLAEVLDRYYQENVEK